MSLIFQPFWIAGDRTKGFHGFTQAKLIQFLCMYYTCAQIHILCVLEYIHFGNSPFLRLHGLVKTYFYLENIRLDVVTVARFA